MTPTIITRRVLNIVFGSLFLGVAAMPASAQPSSPSAPPAQPASPASSGPLIVEKIQNGWLLAPDVRATSLDGNAGALAGGYIGRITDRQWVIGAGGYFLTNRDHDFKLAYGGPVFEWLVRADRRIGFGVRALVGGGSATLPKPVYELVDPRVLASNDAARGDRRSHGGLGLRLIDPNGSVPVQDDFLVAEPQGNVMWNFSQGQRLVFGVGYRAVGSAPLLGDELSGLSYSVSYQLGGK